jgi:FAD/FMN-containing dehydrogenase
VSVIGPLLGGGHSMLQGLHGFASDNLVSARLVLADGSAITVSEKENPDLFWAVRGAGHNFGIITSFEVNVYDSKENWTMIVFTFTQDKLEGFFNTWNKLEIEREDPGLLVLNGVFARNPSIDSNHVSYFYL